MSTSPKIQGVIRRGADRKRNGGAPAWRLRALLAVLGVLGALLVAFLPHLLRMRTAETQLYRGMALLNAGDAAGAEAAWKTAAQSAPANPNVHEALGKLYLAQGRLAEARAALNRQADLGPREPHVLCELAEAEYRAAEGGPDVAEHALRDAVRAATLEPGCVRAQTVAGSLFLEKDDAARAIAHLERAVAANPADVPLTIHLINTLLQENRLDEARGWAERLAGRYPAFAPAHALLGRMYQLGPQNPAQTEKMRRALAAALRLDPMNALAHAVTGHDLLGRNASKQAVRHLEAARLWATTGRRCCST
jgi:tetratricopeptide (TPR) repeat protein